MKNISFKLRKSNEKQDEFQFKNCNRKYLKKICKQKFIRHFSCTLGINIILKTIKILKI